MPRSRPTASRPFCSRRSSFNDDSIGNSTLETNGDKRPRSIKTHWLPNGAWRWNRIPARLQPTLKRLQHPAPMKRPRNGRRWSTTLAACSPPKAVPSASSIRKKSTACSGFSLSDVSLNDNSGIRAIINSAMVSYERLPMLEIVFDRLVRLMTTVLRNFTSDNVEVSLDRITSVRFGDYLNSIPLAGDIWRYSRRRSGTTSDLRRSIPA